jgi:RNA polymerase sigma-70 factor (ECF subfamily)
MKGVWSVHDQERYLNYVTELDIADVRSMMENYGEDVWNYAFILTRDAHLADDIAQETFIKAYRRFHTYRRESSLRTWLLKITRNTAFTYRNKAFLKRVILYDSRPRGWADTLAAKSAVPSAESAVLASMAEVELWTAIMSLPGKYRDPLLLRFHYQLSMEEIAEILGVSEGTVKSRIHRAKQKAAHLLKGRDVHVGS